MRGERTRSDPSRLARPDGRRHDARSASTSGSLSMQQVHPSPARRFARLTLAFVACLAILGPLPPARAADEKPAAGGGLKAGDYVAIIGDSITEQKQYSVFIEDYLTMCRPAADLRATQFGWGGETAPGF